ncbi:MAG: hypothetical protein IBX68_11140 [Dehalococcoidia bacterium]|nr:hypothetical protein [Dehalococcoidia bacterium]
MIRIPPDAQIRSTIRPGSVFYFVEETLHSTKPHFFIVVNPEPLTDRVVILACSSSQIRKVQKRRRTCPPASLVSITPAEYPDFSVDSIIDCNFVLEKTIEQLVEKLSQRKLRMKTQMAAPLVERLRAGILQSPVIERRIKKVLRQERQEGK